MILSIFKLWMKERKFIEGRLIHPLNKVNHIVVGSSKVMQINSEMIGEPILNLAVSGASIEDDIAISLEAVAKVDAKNVYLAADPWLLNIHDGQDRYKSVVSLYDYWIEKISKKMPSQKYLSSAQLAAIDDSSVNLLSLLRNKLHPTESSIPKDGEVEAVAKKAYDGFHIYNESRVDNTRNISDGFPSQLNYSMKVFEYDSKSEENLLLLISYLKSLDVKVTLILSPYHPDLYQLMKTDKPIFIEIENKFRGISQQHNVGIIGSYDPALVGCTSDEFYDGMHPKEACMNKLFNGLSIVHGELST